MRKSQIVLDIAQQLDITQVQAGEAFEALLTEIKDALARGEPVTLRGLGTFSTHAKQARDGRNPKTGEAAAIAARRVVRFKAGQRFKAAVNGELVEAAGNE